MLGNNEFFKNIDYDLYDVMLITIRTDASQQIGYGHVMRCLALAEALRDLGATIEFITRFHLGNLDEYIEKKAFKVHSLPKPSESDKNIFETGYQEWLELKINQDTQESIQVLKGKRPDWLIIDHYSIDYKWEVNLRPYTRKIMVIDDQANRKHDCDLLIDQNYIHDHSRYDHLLSPDTMKLLGPKYALLRKDFLETQQSSMKSFDSIQKVLIFFGGADKDNLTSRALKSLRHPDLKYLSVDVVIGSANQHQSEIKALLAERSNAELHIQVDNIAELMYNADIALGAGGTATWERMAAGLPSIVVTIAENQVPYTRELHRDGYLKWIGNSNQVEEVSISNALLDIIQKPQLLRKRSQKCQELVNGMGAKKTAELMILGPKFDTLEVRKALPSDCLLYWKWTNDQEFQENALYHQNIGWEDYKERFNIILNEPDIIMLLIECEFAPIGQVLVDNSGSHRIVNYFLAKKLYDVSFEKIMLEKAIEFLKREHSLTVDTAFKGRYLESSNKFAELGFCQTGPAKEGSKLFSITILSDGDTWMNQFIYKLLAELAMVGHRICWAHKTSEVPEGDLCFVLSCDEILKDDSLNRNKHNLVVHASDLPKGKGWSPLSWQVLEGASKFPVTLFEAVEKVDSGNIYLQSEMRIRGDELVDEMRQKLAEITISLCKKFVNQYPEILDDSWKQSGDQSFYPKRTPVDSMLDPNKTLAEQFNLLRIVDNERYPAYFDWLGHRYILKIEKEI